MNAETAILYGILGGYAFGKIGQHFALKWLKGTDKTVIAKYYNDYVDGLYQSDRLNGLDLKAKPLADMRAAAQGGKAILKKIGDTIIDPESNPDKWLQYAKELRAGKHNPKAEEPVTPLTFKPRTYTINGRKYTEIWIDNHKRIKSQFFQYVINNNYTKKKLKLPMADGFSYYAIIDEYMEPIFYKKVRIR